MMRSPWMTRAREQARKADTLGEVPVGVVLIEGTTQQVLFEGHNQVESLKDPTAHAEILAIRSVCARQQSPFLSNCDLYVTLEPCPMCAQAISFARIRRLYFGAFNPKGGGVEHGPQIFNQNTCHHCPEVIGGLQEEACIQLLQDFFQDKREA